MSGCPKLDLVTLLLSLKRGKNGMNVVRSL